MHTSFAPRTRWKGMPSHSRVRGLVSTFLCLLLGFPAGAGAGEFVSPSGATGGDITGEVRQQSDAGTTLRGIEILLAGQGEQEGVERRSRTDASGRFVFRDVPAGSWIVEARGIGYETVRTTVEHAGGPRATRVQLLMPPVAIRLSEVVGTANPLGRSTVYQPARALDADELTRRLDVSIGAMLDGEPGVAMRSLGPAPSRPVIRGFDGDRVLVLENGERMGDIAESAADHAVALDPLAIRRVEVVRGPASLLYGSSALGGVVNLLTTDLPSDWARGWSGSFQSQGATMNRSGAAGGSVLRGGESWAATARASFREAGDMRTPESLLPGTGVSSRDAQVGVAGVRGAFRGGISLSLVDRSYGIPEGIEDPDEDIRIEMERRALQLRGAWEPARPGFVRGVEVRGQLAAFDQQELERDLGSAGEVIEEEVELEFDQVAASTTATLRHAPFWKLDEGVVGLALRGRTLEVGGAEAFTPGIRESSAAVFTFHELPIGGHPDGALRAQFGFRGELQTGRALPNEAFPEARDRRDSATLSGSLGLNWRPAPAWELGAQVARAHRNPSVEELYADGPHLGAGAYEIGDPGLDDEIGVGADLFVRRHWAASGIEVAVFMNRIQGFVAFEPTGRVDAPSGLPGFRYESTGARLMGGEISGDVRLGSAVFVKAGVDYVRGERLGADALPLPTMPPLRGRLEARYDVHRWWGGATLRAAASQRRTAAAEAPTDGYALLDTQLGVRLDPDGHHMLVLTVANANNRLYRDHLSRVEERGFPMPARNLSVVYRWTGGR